MDIKAPTFPESITEGTVAQWHKQPGEAVRLDDLLADIETDKVVIEVVAPANGALTEIVDQRLAIACQDIPGGGNILGAVPAVICCAVDDPSDLG